MRVSEYRVLGLLPLSDKRKDIPIQNRALVMAGEVEARPPELGGAYVIKGNHEKSEAPTPSSGDLRSAFHWPNSGNDRPFGSWFFGMPAIAERGSKKPGPIDQSKTITRGRQKTSERARRLVEVRPIKDGAFKADKRYASGLVSLPPEAPDVAKGDQLLVFAGTEDDSTALLGVPFGGGGPLKTYGFSSLNLTRLEGQTQTINGSIVYDTDDKGEVNEKRKSGLAAIWAVIIPNTRKEGDKSKKSEIGGLAWKLDNFGGMVINKPSGKTVQYESPYDVEQREVAEYAAEAVAAGLFDEGDDAVTAGTFIGDPDLGIRKVYPDDPKNKSRATALLGENAGGFISVGEGTDVHRLGVTEEGFAINAAHIATHALFKGPFGDGPLDFERGLHEDESNGGPYSVPVHLRWDPHYQRSTRAIGGDHGLGAWRFSAESQFGYPKKKKKKKKEDPKKKGGGDDDDDDDKKKDDDDDKKKDCQATPGGGGTGGGSGGPIAGPGGFTPGGNTGAGFDLPLDPNGPVFSLGPDSFSGGATFGGSSTLGSFGDAGTFGIAPEGGSFDPLAQEAPAGGVGEQEGPGHRGGDVGKLNPREAEKKKSRDAQNPSMASMPGGGGFDHVGAFTNFGASGGSLSASAMSALQDVGLIDVFGRPNAVTPPRVGDSAAAKRARGLRGVDPGDVPTSLQTIGFGGGVQLNAYAYAGGHTDFTEGGWIHKLTEQAGDAGNVAGLTVFGDGDGSWASITRAGGGGGTISGGVILGSPDITKPERLGEILSGTWEASADPVRFYLPGGESDMYFANPSASGTAVQGLGATRLRHVSTGLEVQAIDTNGDDTLQSVQFTNFGMDLLAGSRLDFTDAGNTNTSSLRMFPGGFGLFDDTYDYFSTDTSNGNIEFHQDVTCQKLTADYIDPRAVEVESLATRPTELNGAVRGIWWDSVSNTLQTWDGTSSSSVAGGGTASQETIARRTTSQTLANSTFTTIALDAEDIDEGGWHSTTVNNSRVTVASVGDYSVAAVLEFFPHATGSRFLYVYVNTTLKLRVNCAANTGSQTTILHVSDILTLSAGDYVEMKGFQSSGGNLNAGGSPAYSSSLHVRGPL